MNSYIDANDADIYYKYWGNTGLPWVVGSLIIAAAIIDHNYMFVGQKGDSKWHL